MNPETTEWNTGQPDNTDGVEDCAQIALVGAGKVYLNDYPCDAKNPYICEVDKYS